MHDSAVSVTDADDSMATPTPLSVNVPTAAKMLGASPRYTWQLIKSRDLPSFKFGRVRRVRVVDIEAYLAQKVDEDREQRAAKASA